MKALVRKQAVIDACNEKLVAASDSGDEVTIEGEGEVNDSAAGANGAALLPPPPTSVTVHPVGIADKITSTINRNPQFQPPHRNRTNMQVTY